MSQLEDAQPEEQPFAVDAELQAAPTLISRPCWLRLSHNLPWTCLISTSISASRLPQAPDALAQNRLMSPPNWPPSTASPSSTRSPSSSCRRTSTCPCRWKTTRRQPALCLGAGRRQRRARQAVAKPRCAINGAALHREDAVAQEPEPLDDLDFDFFSGTDEVATKLDLARAYIDMGDSRGARHPRRSGQGWR
jgi:pilus assembly protein FimV